MQGNGHNQTFKKVREIQELGISFAVKVVLDVENGSKTTENTSQDLQDNKLQTFLKIQ